MTDIAIYLPSLRGGGAERAMVTLANGFVERGLTVDLVLAKAEGPYLGEVEPGVRVVDLGARRVLTSLVPLARYLRDRRPRAILSALNHANVIAVAARSLARVTTRLVVSERNNVSHAQQSSLSLTERAVLPLMRHAYPWADGVIAVSNGVADDLARAISLARERISVVYNPVVTAALVDQAAIAPEHPWFLEGEAPVVLGAGRLTASKDFSTLIRAFAKVRSQRPCRLVILGEGELRNELEELVSRLGLTAEISLPGFANNPFAFMSRASAFVLSSAWEGLPNVLIQAMACGAPVVSTNCQSGPAEILEHGRWGRLTQVGNPEGMANAILATLDETHPPDVAARAQDFGVPQAVSGYLKILLP